jgi:hypothetical protein
MTGNPGTFLQCLTWISTCPEKRPLNTADQINKSPKKRLSHGSRFRFA